MKASGSENNDANKDDRNMIIIQCCCRKCFYKTHSESGLLHFARAAAAAVVGSK